MSWKCKVIGPKTIYRIGIQLGDLLDLEGIGVEMLVEVPKISSYRQICTVDIPVWSIFEMREKIF